MLPLVCGEFRDGRAEWRLFFLEACYVDSITWTINKRFHGQEVYYASVSHMASDVKDAMCNTVRRLLFFFSNTFCRCNFLSKA